MNFFRKQLKFDRIRQQFGCGYYAVCCQTHCPCSLKIEEQYDQEIYEQMMIQFQEEGEKLFGA